VRALWQAITEAPLGSLELALKARSPRQFAVAYERLTQECDACRQSLNRAQVVIKVPAAVEAGLNVLALERGEDASTVPNWAYPKVVDEISQSARNGLLQNLSKTTVTIRHHKNDRALPYRQIGSFKPGTGVGGAGIHWSGVHSRVMPQELRLRSHITERYGARRRRSSSMELPTKES
jgi:hypothetical protein